MAGDWIKMRTGLRRHAKVVAMCRFLLSNEKFQKWMQQQFCVTERHAASRNVTEYHETSRSVTNERDAASRSVTERRDGSACDHHETSRSVTHEIVSRMTVCALLEVWGAINAVIKPDQSIPFMTPEDVDEIAGIPGFADAMIYVGWLCFTEENSIYFNNFGEFNTPESERKEPKTDAERAAEYRARKRLKAAGGHQQNDGSTDENGGENHGVTKRHETSRKITKRHEIKRREEKIRILNNKTYTGSAAPPSPDGEVSGQEVPVDLDGNQPGASASSPPNGGNAGHGGGKSNTVVAEIFDYWVAAMGKTQGNILTDQRKKLVQARLKEGYSVEMIKSAIDGCARSEYHQGRGDNKSGVLYNGLELICRSGEKVEFFANMPPPKTQSLKGLVNANHSNTQSYRDGVTKDGRLI